MASKNSISMRFAEIASHIGLDAAISLAEEFGGQDIYIASSPTEASKVAGIIGLEAAQKLAHVYGGETIYIPKATRFLIAELHANGWSGPDIARRLKISVRAVWQNLAKPDPKKELKQLDFFGD